MANTIDSLFQFIGNKLKKSTTWGESTDWTSWQNGDSFVAPYDGLCCCAWSTLGNGRAQFCVYKKSANERVVAAYTTDWVGWTRMNWCPIRKGETYTLDCNSKVKEPKYYFIRLGGLENFGGY